MIAQFAGAKRVPTKRTRLRHPRTSAQAPGHPAMRCLYPFVGNHLL